MSSNNLPNPVFVLKAGDDHVTLVPTVDIPRCSTPHGKAMPYDKHRLAWDTNGYYTQRAIEMFKHKNYVYCPMDKLTKHFNVRKFCSLIFNDKLFTEGDWDYFAWHLFDCLMLSFTPPTPTDSVYIDMYNVCAALFDNIAMYQLEFLHLVLNNANRHSQLQSCFEQYSKTKMYRVHEFHTSNEGQITDIRNLIPHAVCVRNAPNPNYKWTEHKFSDMFRARVPTRPQDDEESCSDSMSSPD